MRPTQHQPPVSPVTENPSTLSHEALAYRPLTSEVRSVKVPTPLRAIILCSAVALALPAAANAAVRYAVPNGGASSGDCRAAAPCTLRVAVQGAGGITPVDGDDVRLAAGEYIENSPLTIYY